MLSFTEIRALFSGGFVGIEPSAPAGGGGQRSQLLPLIGYRASLNGVTATPQTKYLWRKGSTMEGLVTSLGEAL